MVIRKNYEILVEELKRHVDPLAGALWGCASIEAEEVIAAADVGLFPAEPWDSAEVGMRSVRHLPGARDWHIRRIAKFVKEGLPDDEHAISLQLDETDPKQQVIIGNGNHRIAAAIVRNDSVIVARVTAIDPEEIQRIFPRAKPV
jgi:hypothetical protein